ncbi:hypothetical protein HMP0721_1925 [Pseudoramibacter alactolyticus ATCC 23263]|uniref:Uncharacterized protein n=1 Tax=Pseudoramibacter alactolyticus ATCC 23263 TaxID=887929 RepID=E6MIU0_9FIRM|nr:hypothetical protein HMP0721_1925 [Pseudoramibacter alactolyticus ATCC 23263]
MLIYIRKLYAKKRKSFEKNFYFRKRLFFALLNARFWTQGLKGS